MGLILRDHPNIVGNSEGHTNPPTAQAVTVKYLDKT